MSRRRSTTRVPRGLFLAGAALAAAAPRAPAQEPPPLGRDAALALDFPAIEFQPPEPALHVLPGGVEVLYLQDRSLPLVNVLARFEGGYGRFPREYYAAGMALPSLLRGGGTRSLPPDSLDALLELHAVQVSFGSGGGSVTSTVNALTRELDTALDLWSEMLRAPRFDPDRVEVWRGQELESVLRRKDDPGRLAVSEFNRLMYGDHPVGWEMAPEDLEPERLSSERLQWIARRILCPSRLVLGVTGDVAWEEIEPRLVRILEDWPECEEELPPNPTPRIREGGGVFVIPKQLEQSTVVLAHVSGIRQEDSPDFFASRIGNSILGAGGFSSRLLSRVRTERGYAYNAGSIWTTPRENPGLVGAVTQTRSGSTVAATRLILEIMEEMTREPPTPDEVRQAVDESVNGFVFNFDSPAQVVFRQMVYRAEELPADWLERYLAGIQGVGPEHVLDVFRRVVRPGDMTILVVGDPEGFDEPLEALGPVTVLDPDAASERR